MIRVFRQIWKWVRWPIYVFVFVAPVLFYYISFHGYQISDNPEDWANFGGYVGGVYSVIVAILVIFLSRSLEKRDDRQRNKVHVVKDLYEQINKISSNNHQSSIDKFVKDIEKSKLYLSEGLIKQLQALHGSFQSAHDKTGSIDVELKKSVLQRLKDIYNE